MGRTRWLWVATALAVFAASAARAGAEEIVLAVDADRVLRDGADRFVGINLNYIRDLDSNRPGARPLNEALKDLGVRWLRYPGGEKSDFYLWSQPPYAKPAPMSLLSYAKHAGDRMDFDAYIACCRAVGAESLVVVGCDNEKRTGRTWDQWLENAVTWVRYAKEKKCGVRYWEIGNENWHNQTAPAEEMAKIVARFSKAMKEADPSILTGASLSGDDKWNAPILAGAGPQLDFVTVSVYNTSGWKIYDYFPKHPDANLRQTAATALKAIDRFAAPADRARLKVIVSEMNSKDFAKDGAWPAT
ncbi:MAG: hypothetical protein NT049_08660, partial [Planctomycetota bacterium]|nr:hypothetical protein [Planctomycetota bacterium]